MGETLSSFRKGLKSFVYLAVVGLVACTTGHCRRDGTKVVNKEVSRPSGYEAPKQGSVRVAKPDGSKQCGFSPGVSLNKMAQELGDVKVLSSEKHSDGLMHTASCGSSTGMLNVYEIPENDLAKAEKEGFSVFKK